MKWQMKHFNQSSLTQPTIRGCKYAGFSVIIMTIDGATALEF